MTDCEGSFERIFIPDPKSVLFSHLAHIEKMLYIPVSDRLDHIQKGLVAIMRRDLGRETDAEAGAFGSEGTLRSSTPG